MKFLILLCFQMCFVIHSSAELIIPLNIWTRIPANIERYRMEPQLKVFSSEVYKSVSASDSMLKFFNLTFSKEEVADAFFDVIYNSASFLKLDNPQDVAEATRSAIITSYDPSKYMNVVLSTLEKYLLNRNYLIIPDAVISAYNFIYHIRLAAETITDDFKAKDHVQSLVTAVNNFFVGDILKRGPSLLASFNYDLEFSRDVLVSNTDYVPMSGTWLPSDRSVPMMAYLTEFSTELLHGIYSSESVMKLFDLSFEVDEIGDAVYKVIKEAGVLVNFTDPEHIGVAVKTAITSNFSPHVYIAALTRSVEKYFLQHNFFIEAEPRTFALIYLNYLQKAAEDIQDSDGPELRVKCVVDSTYKVIMASHMQLNSQPSLLSVFFSELKSSKMIIGIDV